MEIKTFTDNVQYTAELMCERIWFEDTCGVRMIERLCETLEKWFNFNLKVGNESFVSAKEELDSFIRVLETNPDTSPVRVNTWKTFKSALTSLSIVAEILASKT
jgi:hypothetical protein